MVTNTALIGLRQHLLDMIAGASYTIDGVTKEVAITSSGLLDDGRASVSFLIEEAKSSGETLTQVCLYDAEGAVLVEKAENIVCEPSMGSVYYRLFFIVDEMLGG